MQLIIDKEYDKNGNEIPRDYRVKEFPELSDFLTDIYNRLKRDAEKAQSQKA